MQQITPFLWFNSNAEEAVNFYLTIFKDAKIMSGVPKGKVTTMKFALNGMEFIALNGGPHYTFSPATSFVVHCEGQAEVDHYWDALSVGGKPNQCGWVTDQFGVTWQIVPSALPRLLSSKEPGQAGRVMQAMMKMNKIIIADLESAAANE